MPRIPYVFPEPGESEIADQMRVWRKDGKLIALEGMFLNAPALAAGFSHMFGAVRRENSLPADLRELLILRVAALNSAAYQWIAHEPIGRDGGLKQEQLAAIRDVSYIRPIKLESHPPPSGALSPLFAAAIAYTDAMTVDVKVPQAVFDAFKVHLDDRKMVEATVTIASYNMISRVLLATDVGDMANVEVPNVETT